MNNAIRFFRCLTGSHRRPAYRGNVNHTQPGIWRLRTGLVILGLGVWCQVRVLGASTPSSGLAQIELNSFLDYQPTKVNPQAVSLPLPLNPSAIDNATAVQAGLRLPDNARQALWRNGFVVVPWRSEMDMVAAYREMPESGIPNFITSDSLLHLYHVQFDEILKDVESSPHLLQEGS